VLYVCVVEQEDVNITFVLPQKQMFGIKLYSGGVTSIYRI
jgi:hypothetical protein